MVHICVSPVRSWFEKPGISYYGKYQGILGMNFQWQPY